VIVFSLKLCTHTHHTHKLSLSLSLSCTITHISAICRHTTMKELTFYQITLFTDCLKTPINYLHPQSMLVLMNIQNALLTECLITYFTGIMALTTAHAFMVYQNNLVTVYLITYVTNIRALTTVFAFMFIKLLLSLYASLHTSQLHGLSPLYMYLWFNRLLLLLYALLHTSQLHWLYQLCMH